MLRKYINHFYLALIFFILCVGQQYSFYALKGLQIIWLTFGKYLTIFFFFLVFTFIQGERVRFFWMSYLLILNFFQMAHLSYFGTLILPNEFFLFFSEFHEVSGVLVTEVTHVLIPLVFTIIPMFLGHLAVKKWAPSKTFKYLPFLIFLYFIYNPLRTFVTGNTWGRQPSTTELSGMNMYLSLSYFTGKILPHKLLYAKNSTAKNQSSSLSVEELESKWDKIIIVLGESLSPDQMSLFDYKRNTTPFLNTLKNDPDFYYTKGLSSGVSTDISVAFFLNLTYGDAGSLKVSTGEHCLFKHAKKMKFSTHFLSIQSRQQLRYIMPYLCSAYLDDLRSLEEISPETNNSNAAEDRNLLPKLNELVITDQKQFIILHQRGSHAPWPLRSTKRSKIFRDKSVDERVNDYDNSVVEFDFFMKELDALLSLKKSKTLLLYLSDHGESVGKEGRYGHGFLARSSFEIPLLFRSYNSSLPEGTHLINNFLPQYNFSLYILNQLGLKTNQNYLSELNDFVIFGNDIDGFAGKASINFTEKNSYDFKIISQ
jgi:glucan phosphoethanolaminetransferase (alkaline phosphatase superfamily)